MTNESKIMVLDKKVLELEAEIADRKKEVDILEREIEYQKKVQLAKIAGNIQVEYDDFKTATDIEMTVDLGENMRIQLKSIFRILKKAGVPLK